MRQHLQSAGQMNDAKSLKQAQRGYGGVQIQTGRKSGSQSQADRLQQIHFPILAGYSGNALQLRQFYAFAERPPGSTRVDAKADGEKTHAAALYAARGTAMVSQRQTAHERAVSRLAIRRARRLFAAAPSFPPSSAVWILPGWPRRSSVFRDSPRSHSRRA